MSIDNGQANILLIVWDACRLDYAKEHARNLLELGDSGVWFENAIAPATWSLPSHASLFTGVAPSEHGVTQPSQSRMPTDLVDSLNTIGYTSYGVSGNGFAGPLWGFDEAFDDFRSSQGPEPYLDGIPFYHFLRTELESGTSKAEVITAVIRKIVRNKNIIKNSVNFAAVVGNHLARERFPSLKTIPSPVFRKEIEETYHPNKNTAPLTNYIEEGARGGDPFFIFSNYMDTHRPYVPPSDLQRAHIGTELDDAELDRLNNEVADPWTFITLDQDNEIDDADIETLRKLYAGEVESVDRHLGHLLDALQKNGVLEDTLVIVTADHGENLGETDILGDRRMGHEASLSDHLCRVPLAVYHPSLESTTIEQPFSLTSLYELIQIASSPDESLASIDLTTLSSTPVACEYPALGDKAFYQKHPGVNKEVAARRVSIDSVSAYQDRWKVIGESTGMRVAAKDNQIDSVGNAPNEIRDHVESILDRLGDVDLSNVNTTTQGRLEDLGYL